MILEAILAGLFGLLIGSFLNVCIYRLPRDMSVIRPRSFCPSCRRQIAWFDNIPLLSFALLAGRCRHCRARIPARYPIVETLIATAFFWAVWLFGPGPAAAKVCTFAALLIGLIFSDLEERVLPDELTLGGVLLGLLFAVVAPIEGGFSRFLLEGHPAWMPSLVESVSGAVISAGALWLLGAIYKRVRHREGLGFGDVKMVALIGAFLGLQGVLLTLICGSLLGAVAGVVYIVLASKDASTYELPFGTFLGVAALGMAFFGGPILGWYSRFSF